MALPNPFLRGRQWSAAVKLYFLISIVHIILNIIVELLFIFAQKNERVKKNPYVVFGALFVFTQVISAGMIYYALLYKSVLVLTTELGFEICTWLYVITQSIVIERSRAYSLILVAILPLGIGVKCGILWKRLRREFEWLVYRALGANLALKRGYLLQQSLLGMVMIESVVYLLLLIQYLVVISQSAQTFFVGLLVCVALEAALWTTHFGLVQEMRWLLCTCITTNIGIAGLFVYFMVKVKVIIGEMQTFVNFMTVFLVLGELLLITIVVLSILSLKNLGLNIRTQLKQIKIVDRGQVDLEEMDNGMMDSKYNGIGGLNNSTMGGGGLSNELTKYLFTMEKAKSAGNPGANSNEYILDLSLSDTTHMGHSGTIGTRGVNRNRGGIDATNRGGVASKFGRKGNFLFFWRRDKKNAPEVRQRVSAPINEPRISGFTTTQTMIRDVHFATTNSTTNNISMFLRGYSERGNIEINHFPGLNRSANESYGEENIAQFSANLSDVEIDEKYQDISRGLTFSQEEIEIMNGRI